MYLNYFGKSDYNAVIDKRTQAFESGGPISQMPSCIYYKFFKILFTDALPVGSLSLLIFLWYKLI